MDLGADRPGLAERLAARSPQERAATTAANAIGVLVAAEALTAFVGPAAGAIADALVVVWLLNRRALLDRSEVRAGGVRRGEYAAADLLAVVALVALVRLIGLATPFDLLAHKVWYAAIATPILVGLAATARLVEPAWAPPLPRRGGLLADLVVVLGGVAAGLAGAIVLPRSGAAAGLDWAGLAIVAAVALLAALALDRAIFRDGMRGAARAALASPRWPLGVALAAIVALALPSVPVAVFLAVTSVALAAAPRAGASLAGLAAAQVAVILLTILSPALA